MTPLIGRNKSSGAVKNQVVVARDSEKAIQLARRCARESIPTIPEFHRCRSPGFGSVLDNRTCRLHLSRIYPGFNCQALHTQARRGRDLHALRTSCEIERLSDFTTGKTQSTEHVPVID